MDSRIKSWAWEVTLLLLVVFIVAYSWSFSAIQLPEEIKLAKRLAELLSEDPDARKPAEWIHLLRTWVAIPLTLFGFQMMRRTLKTLEMDAPAVDLTSLAWVLGSSMFAFSTTMTGHQIAALSLLTGFYAILRAEFEVSVGRERQRHLVGWGALAGLSLTTVLIASPPSTMLVILLVGYVVLGPLFRAPPFLMMCGALMVPGVLAFGIDDFSRGQALMESMGLAGPLTVDVGALKTLIAANPALLAIPFAFFVLLNRSSLRLAALVLLGSMLAVWLGMAEASAQGAAAMVPALVLVFFGVGFAADAGLSLAIPHGLIKGLAIAGVYYQITLQAFVPKFRESQNPLVDLIPEMWKAKIVAPNLGQTLFGLTGTQSLIPLILATMIVLGILLVRGASWLDTPRRFPLVILAVAVVAMHLAFLSHFGGHLPPDKQKKIMRTVDVWNQNESSFRKDANKAVKAIDAIGR